MIMREKNLSFYGRYCIIQGGDIMFTLEIFMIILGMFGGLCIITIIAALLIQYFTGVLVLDLDEDDKRFDD